MQGNTYSLALEKRRVLELQSSHLLKWYGKNMQRHGPCASQSLRHRLRCSWRDAYCQDYAWMYVIHTFSKSTNRSTVVKPCDQHARQHPYETLQQLCKSAWYARAQGAAQLVGKTSFCASCGAGQSLSICVQHLVWRSAVHVELSTYEKDCKPIWYSTALAG